jgi:hypothetical protein
MIVVSLALPLEIRLQELAKFLERSREISAISIPANVTDSASGRSRLPLHIVQSRLVRNCATLRFIKALCVVAKVCRTYLRAPIKVP